MALHSIFDVDIRNLHDNTYTTHYVRWDDQRSSIRVFVNNDFGENEVADGNDMDYTPSQGFYYMVYESDGDVVKFREIQQFPYAEQVIEEPEVPPLVLTLTGQNPTVPGNLGQITATGSGGIGPYSIRLEAGSWLSGSSQTFNVAPGTYIVYLRDDGNGAIIQKSITITDAFTFVVTPTHVTVIGGNNGTIHVKVDQTGQFEYRLFNKTTNNWITNWQIGNDSITYSQLISGTYSVYVRRGGYPTTEQTKDVTITQPNPTPLGISISARNNVSVVGNTDGSVTILGAGGTKPYGFSYSKNNGTQSPYQSTSNDSYRFSGLGYGSYRFFLKDSSNTILFVDAVITEPLVVYYRTSATYSNETPTGDITVTGTSGVTGAIYYSLVYPDNTTTAWSSQTLYSSLAAGVYTLKAKDDYGRTWERAITISLITATELELILIKKTNLLLHGKNSGYIRVLATGGFDPLTYSVDGITWSTNPEFKYLAAGTYTVTVKDNVGSTDSLTVTLTEPPFNYESMVHFTHTVVDPGYMETTVYQSDEFNEEQALPAVSGVTDSKLEVVKSYKLDEPYIVGINGVTEVTSENVIYTIDGITYDTRLSDEYTTYSFGLVGLNRDNSISQHIVKRETDRFTGKHKTIDNIDIERNEISVFETMYRIANINVLDDFETYF